MGQARTHDGMSVGGGKDALKRVPELSVVGAPAGGVDQATRDARNEELVRDLELGYRVQRLFPRSEHRVEFLGLWDRTWETVEYEAIPKQVRNNKN